MKFISLIAALLSIVTVRQDRIKDMAHPDAPGIAKTDDLLTSSPNTAPTSAGPIEQSARPIIDLVRMADSCSLVMEGRVKSSASAWSADGKTISTAVTFEQVNFYKGQLDGSSTTVTLEFPGGKVGDDILILTGSPEYAVGQKWILFLLPEYRISPVYGINQGVFNVIQDSEGVERVYTANGQKIEAVTTDGKIQLVNAISLTENEGNEIATNSQDASTSPFSIKKGISLDIFRNRIGSFLSSSRNYPASNLPRKISTQNLRSPEKRGLHPPQSQNEESGENNSRLRNH